MSREHDRAVATGCNLASSGKHDVDVGMGGVAVLGREPRTDAAGIRFQLGDGRASQLGEVEALGYLGRKNKAIGGPAAVTSCLAPSLPALLGQVGNRAADVGGKPAPVQVGDRALAVEKARVGAGAVAMGDVF